MGELESDAVATIGSEDVGMVKEKADSAAAAEKEKSETERFQEKLESQEKALAEKAYKEREARRKAESLERRLEELERKKPETDLKLNVPEVPDPFDDDYQEKLRARENALIEQAKRDAAQAYRLEQQVLSEKEQERKRLEDSERKNAQLMGNAKKLGLDEQEYSSYETKFIDHINRLGGVKDPEMINMIIDDPSGPLVIKHLAANPLDVDDLLHASPYRAGALYASIKSKAESLRPKTSRAPNPATIIEGRGTPAKKRGVGGTTYT